jgi:hypothetical protein
MEIDREILKLIQKLKGPGTAKAMLKKKAGGLTLLDTNPQKL